MANIKPLFKIKDDGFLYVSYDNGCTYEAIGEVVGPQGEQGEEGPQGETGEDGVNGENGANAKNPFIDGTTGTWWVYDDETGEAYDTHVLAMGASGAVVVDQSADIGNVGIPSVSSQVVENTLHIQFHELKGEPGKDGSSYRAGEHIEINEPEEEGLLPSIDCALSAGVDISIDESDRINVVPSYTKRAVQQAEVSSYSKTTITSNVDGKPFSIASIYTTHPSMVSSPLSITYSKSASTTQYIHLFDADGNGNNWQDFSLTYDGKTYYFCASEETSPMFTIMTDCPLRLYGFNPEDRIHAAYIEIPAWYHGSIVFHAGRYLTSTGKCPESEEHAWSSSGSFAGTLLSALPSQSTITVSRYTYDMIVTDDLSAWEVPASEVTALRLSKLEERVTYLEHEVSSMKDELSDMHTTLTLGSTTLSENELQQLKALLQ